MPTDIIKQLLEALKLAPKYLVATALVFVFLLFGPFELRQVLGVQDVAKDYRAAIGVGLLACVAILGVEAGRWLFAKVRAAHHLGQRNLRITQRLCRLTEDEKQVLRLYIGQQTRTQRFSLDNGVINGLRAAAILHPAARLAGYTDFPHNITQAAWDVLNKAPSLLD